VWTQVDGFLEIGTNCKRGRHGVGARGPGFGSVEMLNGAWRGE
jgi:hypothetical protein